MGRKAKQRQKEWRLKVYKLQQCVGLVPTQFWQQHLSCQQEQAKKSLPREMNPVPHTEGINDELADYLHNIQSHVSSEEDCKGTWSPGQLEAFARLELHGHHDAGAFLDGLTDEGSDTSTSSSGCSSSASDDSRRGSPGVTTDAAALPCKTRADDLTAAQLAALFPVQVAPRLQVNMDGSFGKRQGSRVGRKVLPGEKKRLRKEGIEAKRARRDIVEVLRVNQQLEELVMNDGDMEVFNAGKHGVKVLCKMAGCYGLKATVQGSSNKKLVMVMNTSRSALPHGGQQSQLNSIMQQELQCQVNGWKQLKEHGRKDAGTGLPPRQSHNPPPSTDVGAPAQRPRLAPVVFVSSGVLEEKGNVLITAPMLPPTAIGHGDIDHLTAPDVTGIGPAPGAPSTCCVGSLTHGREATHGATVQLGKSTGSGSFGAAALLGRSAELLSGGLSEGVVDEAPQHTVNAGQQDAAAERERGAACVCCEGICCRGLCGTCLYTATSAAPAAPKPVGAVPGAAVGEVQRAGVVVPIRSHSPGQAVLHEDHERQKADSCASPMQDMALCSSVRAAFLQLASTGTAELEADRVMAIEPSGMASVHSRCEPGSADEGQLDELDGRLQTQAHLTPLPAMQSGCGESAGRAATAVVTGNYSGSGDTLVAPRCSPQTAFLIAQRQPSASAVRRAASGQDDVLSMGQGNGLIHVGASNAGRLLGLGMAIGLGPDVFRQQAGVGTLGSPGSMHARPNAKQRRKEQKGRARAALHAGSAEAQAIDTLRSLVPTGHCPAPDATDGNLHSAQVLRSAAAAIPQQCHGTADDLLTIGGLGAEPTTAGMRLPAAAQYDEAEGDMLHGRGFGSRPMATDSDVTAAAQHTAVVDEPLHTGGLGYRPRSAGLGAACLEQAGTPQFASLGQFELHTTGFGSRMLTKWGFQEGKGLGKNADGRTAPVESVMRPKRLGLGA